MTVLMFALVVICIIVVIKTERVLGSEEKYLYAILDKTEYEPITEFTGAFTDASSSSSHNNDNDNDDDSGSSSDSSDNANKDPKDKTPPAPTPTPPPFQQPPFLSKSSKVHRVVEFYAPWCPHCQHFKPTYIKFAREMIPVAQKYNTHVEFWAVSCTAYKNICSGNHIEGYPTLKLFPAGKDRGIDVKPFSLHPFKVLSTFGVDVDEAELSGLAAITEKVDDVAIGLRQSIQSVITSKTSPHDIRTKQDIYSDAVMSFHFAMKNSIFMAPGPLVDSTRTAFREWIHLLGDTLPPTWSQIHQPLQEISKHIKKVTKSEKNLLQILKPHTPQKETWSDSCTKNTGHGYTCGLWELFHTMTIGVVEWNKNAMYKRTIWTAEEAADALHDYISNFFACDVCRTNFIDAYDACEHDRCTRLGSSTDSETEWKALSLWLWETHNSVNVRLLREKFEREKKGREPTREEIRDVQWPSWKDCPVCWDDIQGSYSDVYVYQYLRLTYWHEDAVNKKIRIKLEKAIRRQRQELKSKRN